MFLFTDKAKVASKPAINEALPHATPLKQASRATGVSFNYLAKTAERESRFNPQAKAQTSSATGMFQFIEQTWLGMVKQEGGRIGLTQEAAAITSENGRMKVSDPALKQKILNLREDPAVSAMMAGAFAAKNGQMLQDSLGRKPTEGELYMAHFLGPVGARDMINLAEKTPDAKAAGSFREAAAANRPIFFDAAGRAKSASEVYSSITSSFAPKSFSPTPIIAPQSQEASAAKSADMYRLKSEGKPMHGLFRSNGEAVADSVQQTWGNIGQRHKIVGEQRIPFHPTDNRTTGITRSIDAASPPSRAVSIAALLQARPNGLETLSSAQVAGSNQRNNKATAQIAQALPQTDRARPGQPLDLKQFARVGRVP
jgi:Transglycosylase SLT domain